MARPSTLEVTAHHEAGHAVAVLLARAVGLPSRDVMEVTVEPSDAWLGIMMPVPLGHKMWPDVGDLEGRAILEASVVSTLAGPVAEARRIGRKPSLGQLRLRFLPPESDGMLAESLVRPLTHGNAEMNAYLRYLWQRTLLLSRFPTFWPCVDAVAAELLASRTMDGQRVQAIVAAIEAQPGATERVAAHVEARMRWRGQLPPIQSLGKRHAGSATHRGRPDPANRPRR
jgi:hypothetical protein